MKRILVAALAACIAMPASGQQSTYLTPGGQPVDGRVDFSINGSGQAVPVAPLTPMPSVIMQGGNTANVSIDGALGVNPPPAQQFSDFFSTSLDTAVNWTTNNSGGTAATSNGALVVSGTTTASQFGGLATKQSFSSIGASSQVFGLLATFNTIAIANTSRVFGVYTSPGTPTLAAPITDGYVFRLDAAGSLFAEVWASGVAVSSTNITTTCAPTANIPGAYFINFRTSLVQFGCNAVNSAAIAFVNPVNQTLPISAYSIAGLSNPGSAATMSLSAVILASYANGCVKTAGQSANVNDCAVVVTSPPYSAGQTPLTGNAAGTTGAVVGTLGAVANQTTYICSFNVQAIGGTAPVGPITIAGLIGSSQVYQGSASAAGGTIASQIFTPCIPASASNTPITITTTANGTATAVNVNSSGYRQ